MAGKVEPQGKTNGGEPKTPVTPDVQTTPPSPTPAPPDPIEVTLPPETQVEIPPSSTTVEVPKEETPLFWRQRYDGMRGGMTAASQQWGEERGSLVQTIKQLESQNKELHTMVAGLTKDKTGLQGQITDLPNLRERAELADEKEKQAARLQQIMLHPAIVNSTVVTKTKDEESGVETETRENIHLDLLMSSTLPDENFETTLAKLSAQLAAGGQTPTGVPPGGGTQPPPPPEPKPMASSLDEANKKYHDAWLAGDIEGQRAANDEISRIKTEMQEKKE